MNSDYNWEPGEVISLFNGRKFKRVGRNETSGRFGTLFEVIDVASDVRMMVKRVSNNDPRLTIDDATKEEALKREAFTLLTLPPHPNIVQSSIVANIRGNYHIFMEFVDSGDLSSLLKEYARVNKKIEWSELYPLIYQMAVGVKFLHSNEIIHKDLKPGNILVKKINTEDPHMMKHLVKIADFGMVSFREILESNSSNSTASDLSQDDINKSKSSSTILGQDDRGKVGNGPFCDVFYEAPELEGLITFNQRLDKFIDVFSFGIVLLELVTNQMGFKENSEFLKILSNFDPLDIPSNLAAANLEIQDEIDHYVKSHRQDTIGKIKDIVKKCLELDPLDRFQDFSEIIGLLEEIDDLTIRHNNEVEFKPSMQEILFWALRGESLKKLDFEISSKESYRKALKLPCKSLTDHFNKGRILQDLDEHQKAISEFDECISINQDYIDAYIHKGVSYSSLGDHEEAVREYVKAERIDSEDPLIYYNKGNALRKLNKYDDAISSFDKALKISPCYIDAFYNKANCFCLTQRFNQALRCVETAIECEPSDQSLHSFRENILAELKKEKQ